MNTTTILDIGELLEFIKVPILQKIRQRLEEEIKPQVETIYQEEVAKYSLEIGKWISAERAGTDLRITIHRPEEKK